MKIRAAGWVALSLLPLLGTSPGAWAQQPPPLAVAPSAPIFTRAQLDQILAPIALYPDQLLMQVLIAATYPQQILDAAQWLQDPANAGLAGDELVAALQPLPWDPAVKSLVAFPQIVETLSQHIDWTEALGIAFANQQGDTMARVQFLRQQAVAAGTLQSTPQVVIQRRGPVIVIEPAEPDIVYLPDYNPAVVYGAWPYAAYPPVYLPLPGYIGVPPDRGIAYGARVAVVAPLWRWGHPDWAARHVALDPRAYARLTPGRRLPPGAVWRHQGPVRLVAPGGRPPRPPPGNRPPGTVPPNAVAAPLPQNAPPPGNPPGPPSPPQHGGPDPAPGAAPPPPQHGGPGPVPGAAPPPFRGPSAGPRPPGLPAHQRGLPPHPPAPLPGAPGGVPPPHGVRSRPPGLPGPALRPEHHSLPHPPGPPPQRQHVPPPRPHGLPPGARGPGPGGPRAGGSPQHHGGPAPQRGPQHPPKPRDGDKDHR